jgi:hypothetical protein
LKVLNVNNHVRTFDSAAIIILSGLHFHDADAEVLGSLFSTSSNSTLLKIDLRGVKMTDRGADCLGRGLLSNDATMCSAVALDGWELGSVAKTLDVSGKLSVGYARLLAGVLKGNTTLDSIVIGSKDKPATIPLKELRENSIDALDYQGKELLAEGGIVLASALKGNSSVTKVCQNALNVLILFYSL